MSRRWGDSAIYEREPSVYAPSGRSSRRELDVELDERRSARPARSVPDFMREDYGRTSAGALVRVEDDEYERPRRRGAPREETREEIIIRDEKRPAPPRSRIDDDTRSVRSSVSQRPRVRPRSEERSREEIDIRIRRDEPEERPRVRNRDPRDVEREEVVIRRSETDRPRSVVDRDDISFRRGEVERSRPRPRETEQEEIIIRRGRSHSSSSSSASPSPAPSRRRRESSSERVIFRPRERSLPPTRDPRDKLVAREREEFVIRRRRPSSPSPSPSPPPMRDPVKEEIIIRRTERSPTPPPPAPPPPPPEPEVIEPEVIRRPIIREEVHRDIIYHHRHYDHGVEIVRREPTPPQALPPPPPEPEPVKEEKLEVSIRHKYVPFL